MAVELNLLTTLSATLTVVGALLAFIYRELRTIHKQQAAQGTLLLLLVENDGDLDSDDLPDELRSGVLP